MANSFHPMRWIWVCIEIFQPYIFKRHFKYCSYVSYEILVALMILMFEKQNLLLIQIILLYILQPRKYNWKIMKSRLYKKRFTNFTIKNVPNFYFPVNFFQNLYRFNWRKLVLKKIVGTFFFFLLNILKKVNRAVSKNLAPAPI